MRIAVDAMGGDNAPKAIVQGAVAAAKEWNDVEIVLVGDEGQIKPFVDANQPNIQIIHTTEVIKSDDEPVKAVRRKKDSSMVICAKMMHDGEVDAMISAGNTGALMTSGLLVVGRVKGIDRPALTATFPTTDGKGCLVLDVGSNMDASVEQLCQYALMGHIYSSQVKGIDQPRIGLLNVGTEENKGNELTKQAYERFQQLPINFVGNVEARDVLEGVCDVLVCDGFVGNILLKSVEGAALTVFKLLKESFTKSLKNKLAAAVLKSDLYGLKDKLDYSSHGGAPLLGVNGVCIKGHGSSNDIAIKNAIREARKTVQSQLVQKIATEIQKGDE